MMGAFSGNGISTDTGNIANGLAAIQNGTSLDGQTTTDFQNALGAMGGLSKVSSLLGGGNSGLMSGLTGLMGGRRRLVDLIKIDAEPVEALGERQNAGEVPKAVAVSVGKE